MAISYEAYHMQSTNKIIPEHPWDDCSCGFKARFNSGVCPLSTCTPAGDGISHSPIVGIMISNSKPTEPEPEQSQDGNIHLTDPGRAGEGNADMANAGMANAGVANAGTGIGEPRPLQIEPEPEFWPEPHPSPDQRRQTGGNKPTAINQLGQQTSLQKVP